MFPMLIASPHMTLSCLLRRAANEAPEYSDGSLRNRAQRPPEHLTCRRGGDAYASRLRALR
jgi:hypothetical protein